MGAPGSVDGEQGKLPVRGGDWNGSPAEWLACEPQMHPLRADTFLEERRRVEAERRSELVKDEASCIRRSLMDGDVSDGYVMLPRVTNHRGLQGVPYPENVAQLRENGFRVWEITEVWRSPSERLSDMKRVTYHVTWDDGADFTFAAQHKHYAKENGVASMGLDGVESTYREVV